MRLIVNNILLGILFSITFFFVVFSLTVLNKNFIYKIFKDNSYYHVLEERLNSYDIDKKRLESDLKVYVKKRYSNEYFSANGQVDRDAYNNVVKFDGYFDNINITLIIYIIYLITIVLIIITGIIFKKNKGYHDLLCISLINFLISSIVFGWLFLFIKIDNSILDIIKDTFIHYYLAFAIIIFELFLLKRIKAKFL